VFERLRKDWALLSGALRTLRKMKPITRYKNRTFPDVISELAVRYGERPALMSNKESFSFRQLDARANRYARWAQANGIGKGDVVALLMMNRPDYMAIWLGVTRAGGVVALLNTNLAGQGLAHCIDIVVPKHVIVGPDLETNFNSARSLLKTTPRIWTYETESEARLDEAVESFGDGPLSATEKPRLTIEDRALFIYTSGTTGLPKAANINHYRLMAITHGFCGVMNVKTDDIMFDVLPMYHSNGGVIATGATLLGGGSVVIRTRFSAREFWADVAHSKATIVFYIGELCRYLLNAPESPFERKHNIRLFCGNGLRGDVWNQFQKRFAIPKIVEWYAATEGNVAVFNWDGTPGAVGRIPWWMESRFSVKVVRFDVEREEPVRGPDGLCIEAAPGETGEVIGEIVNDPSKPANRFEGYADAEATKKKILRDVVKKGDMWFRTGDLMRKDENGYFYFVDRIGDTFRWKGENVSTIEVAHALTGFPGVEDAIVYGVTVPGNDGRAGMATVVAQPGFDHDSFASHIAEHLPEYARPVFLRQGGAIDVTGTFKQRRLELQREGFDPAKVKDPLFFRDPVQNTYIPLTDDLRARICEGKVRL